MARQYITQSFNPVITEKEAGRDEVSKQLGAAISNAAAQGWTFHSYEAVDVQVKAGCLAALAGRGMTTINYGVLVFYREG